MFEHFEQYKKLKPSKTKRQRALERIAEGDCSSLPIAPGDESTLFAHGF